MKGIDAPRTRSVDLISRLPSARTVSNSVFQWSFGGMTPVSAVFSTFLTHHGQFIDHDIIATPSEIGKITLNIQKRNSKFFCYIKQRQYQYSNICFSSTE